MASFDPVRLIVSAYALGGSETLWLNGLAETARHALGLRNIGAYALTYDASDITACRFGPLCHAGIESAEVLGLLRKDIPDGFRDAPAVVDAVFRKTPYGPSGKAGKRDPERAVAQWRALVDARWSLVDHFERDGKRYLLAQRNDPVVAPFALLTARERQVVALAAMGHANKMIGYELGISVSTAGVLLSRAARKLGVPSRAELVTAYEVHVHRAAHRTIKTRRAR